jgi:tetratricopeptide (TPR) repeat protein
MDSAHVAVEPASDDYRHNLDPALKAALEYVPRPTLTELLDEALSKGGAEQAIKSFRRFKADPINKYAATEPPLLEAGYRLLGEKKPEQAFFLLKLNAEENPSSALNYRALGETYLQMGNKQQAIKNFKKALEINPKFYESGASLRSLEK